MTRNNEGRSVKPDLETGEPRLHIAEFESCSAACKDKLIKLLPRTYTTHDIVDAEVFAERELPHHSKVVTFASVFPAPQQKPRTESSGITEQRVGTKRYILADNKNHLVEELASSISKTLSFQHATNGGKDEPIHEGMSGALSTAFEC